MYKCKPKGTVDRGGAECVCVCVCVGGGGWRVGWGEVGGSNLDVDVVRVELGRGVTGGVNGGKVAGVA